MSDLIIVEKSDLVDIADALREQTNETELMSIKAMPPKIRTLSQGGPVVQADWSQNDETAPDYVKNRTHYKAENRITLIDNYGSGDSNLISLYDVDLFSKLSPNAQCIVILNGVSYETVARHSSFNAYDWYILGNGDLIGEDDGIDTTLPFGLYIDEYNENWGEATETVNSLTIEAVTETVVKIPEIYLPPSIGKVGSEEFSEIFNDLTNNTATQPYAHAQNFKTTASGYASHAEGIQTTASGYGSHAQGVGTTAEGTYSHAEGYGTLAKGPMSHAEGEGTIAAGENQHVSGTYNIEDDSSLVIVGNGTVESSRSNAYRLAKNGDGYYAGDVFVGAESKKLATEDSVLLKTAQTLTDTEIEQVHTNLKSVGRSLGGKKVTIDGTQYTASATAEIFGDYTSNIAVGDWSIAEGSGTIAKGRASHTEGAYGKALQDGCHVEGYGCTASGYWSHAEGEMTVVSSYASHAEGSYCTLPNGTKRYGTAAGYASHIEGGGCLATGSCSHAEGLATTVSGAQSHAEGRYTIASGGAQHVEGIANIEDAEGKYIHIAGNGSFDTPSNAYTLDWSGNGWYAGSVEATAIILTSPNGTRFKITVTDTGELTTSAI